MKEYEIMKDIDREQIKKWVSDSIYPNTDLVGCSSLWINKDIDLALVHTQTEDTYDGGYYDYFKVAFNDDDDIQNDYNFGWLMPTLDHEAILDTEVLVEPEEDRNRETIKRVVDSLIDFIGEIQQLEDSVSDEYDSEWYEEGGWAD